MTGPSMSGSRAGNTGSFRGANPLKGLRQGARAVPRRAGQKDIGDDPWTTARRAHESWQPASLRLRAWVRFRVS